MGLDPIFFEIHVATCHCTSSLTFECNGGRSAVATWQLATSSCLPRRATGRKHRLDARSASNVVAVSAKSYKLAAIPIDSRPLQ